MKASTRPRSAGTATRRGSPSSARARGAPRSASCSARANPCRCWPGGPRRRPASRRTASTTRTCPASSCRTGVARVGRSGRSSRRRISSSSRCRRRTFARSRRSSRRSSTPDADVLSLVKGLEGGSLLRMSEVIAEAGGIDVAPRRRAVGPEPRGRDRARPARVGRRRRRGPGARAADPGSGRDARVPPLRQRRHRRRRAVRGAEEHRRDRRGRRRRPRVRRQRQGRADHARPRRDDPARPGGRRQSADVRRAGRHRRRRRDVRVGAVAQSPPRRRAGPGPALGRDRGDAARRRGGRLHGASRRSLWRTGWASRCRSRARCRAALFEGKSVQRCLVDLLARESKDELADLPPWLERVGVSAAP